MTDNVKDAVLQVGQTGRDFGQNGGGLHRQAAVGPWLQTFHNHPPLVLNGLRGLLCRPRHADCEVG